MHKQWTLFFVVVLAAPLQARGTTPYWDQFPRIVQGVDLSTALSYSANVTFNAAQNDPTWGTYFQKHQHQPWQSSSAHAAGLKNISYYETFGQAYSPIAEIGAWDEVNLTPIIHQHWGWQAYSGGTIRWLGSHNFFDDEDFARPYTRTHPVYGGPPMTYPDATVATGYFNNDSTDPRNSRVYDAGSSKDVLGNLSVEYGFNDVANNAGQTTGLLTVPGESRKAGLVFFKKDAAAPAWNDYTYASTRMAADAGMDGMWTDNFSPWDSFGNPPVKHAFGDWSVARFRDHLSTNFSPVELANMGVGNVNTFDITTELQSIMQGYGGNSSNLNSSVWKDSRWLDEPLWRAYTIFKRQTGTEALTNYYNTAHQAAADAGVTDFMVAGNDIPGFSLGWARGDLDLVSTEWSASWGLSTGPQGVGLPPIGRSAPGYKLAREHAKSRFVNVWLYKDGFETELAQPNTSRVMYYEMLSTHALPMFMPNNARIAGTPAANIAFNDFVSQVEPEFGDRTAVEEIGIYYSSSSILSNYTPGGYFDHADQPHQFGYYGWASALGELHYQYQAVPEWKLDAQTLADLRVLIVPESEVFDLDDVNNVLTPWVNSGGLLIVTGESGRRYGEASNFNVKLGGYTLASLTGVSNILIAPSEQLQNVGLGKVLYIRDNIGLDFYNADVTRSALLSDFDDAMTTLLAGSDPMLIGADTISDSVGLTLYEDTTAERLFVDVNNYDINVATDQITDTGALTFDVELPAWLQNEPLRVRVFSPELVPVAGVSLLASDRAEITLDSVRYYTSVLIEAVLLGDMDGNGLVDVDDIDDFVLALENEAAYLLANPGMNVDMVGDMDGSGILDLADVDDFINFLNGIPSAPGQDQAATVPEPSTMLLLAMGLAGLLGNRRKNRRIH